MGGGDETINAILPNIGYVNITYLTVVGTSVSEKVSVLIPLNLHVGRDPVELKVNFLSNKIYPLLDVSDYVGMFFGLPAFGEDTKTEF